MRKPSLPIYIILVFVFAEAFLACFSPLAVSTGSTHVLDIPDNDGTTYDVSIIPNTTSTLYLLNSSLNVFRVSLARALPFSCRNMSIPLLTRKNYLAINAVTSVNGCPNIKPFRLPNGTLVKSILYLVYDYVGCTRDKARLLRVVTTLESGGSLNVYLAVAVPVKDPDKYTIRSILYPKDVIVIYRYFNSTHLEVDLELYNASYDIGGETVPSKVFDIKYRFLVNIDTWESWYWNGERWVPAGIFPLATPLIAPAIRIYDLYHSYYMNAEYYLSHPKELRMVVMKMIGLRKAGEWEKANSFLDQLAEKPLYEALRITKAVYLGKKIEIDYCRDTVVGPSIHVFFPSVTGISVKTMDFPPKNIEEQLVKAIIEYVVHGNRALLEKIVEKYNGFVTGYGTWPMEAGWSSLMWASIFNAGEPCTDFMVTALPGKPLNKRLGLDDEIAYALMTLMPVSNHTVLKTYHDVPLRPYISMIENGKSGYTLLAIDSRLAKALLFNIKNANAVINNLISNLLTSYKNTWLQIVNGDNSTKLLKDFIVEINQTVKLAGLRLAGQEGVKAIENIIKHDGRIMLTEIHGFSTSSNRIIQTSTTPNTRETQISIENAVTSNTPGRSTEHCTGTPTAIKYAYCIGAAVTLSALLIIYYLLRRRRR